MQQARDRCRILTGLLWWGGYFGELQHTHVESGMILKWTLRDKRCKGVEWLHLAEDKGQGMAVVDI